MEELREEDSGRWWEREFQEESGEEQVKAD